MRFLVEAHGRQSPWEPGVAGGLWPNRDAGTSSRCLHGKSRMLAFV